MNYKGNFNNKNPNMMMERPPKTSAFKNPSTLSQEASTTNRSVNFKKFGNLPQNQFQPKQFQNNQNLRFSNATAFNNKPFSQNNMLVEEENQNQNFRNNQGRTRNPNSGQNYEERQQSFNKNPSPFHQNGMNFNNNNQNKQFSNNGFQKSFPPKKNSINDMPIEDDQKPNTFRPINNGRTSTNAFNFQGRNKTPNDFKPNFQDSKFKNANSINNKNFSSSNNQRKKQTDDFEQEGMDLEEDQSNFRANKNVTRQREFQNEDGPFDKEKWNTRLKKNNFKNAQEQDPDEDDQDDFRNKKINFSNRNFKKNTNQNVENEIYNENSDDSPEKSNDFQRQPRKLMVKRNQSNTQNQQQPQRENAIEDRRVMERKQKPHERMIRRLITQPGSRINNERSPMQQNFPQNRRPQTQRQTREIDDENDFNEPVEEKEEFPVKTPMSMGLMRRNPSFQKNFNQENNLNEEAKSKRFEKSDLNLMKEKLKKIYHNTNNISEIPPTSNVFNNTLNNKWRMCTEGEGRLREISRQLDIFERDPTYYVNGEWINGMPKAKPEWCVKKYTRSDAGKEYEEPFPLSVLETMLNYIIDNIIDVDNLNNVPYMTKDGSGNHNFFDIYQFVYDRFRGINKDLTVLKDDTKRETIDILEKMLRFFILSINEGSDYDEYEMFRNIERITDFGTTLISCYKKSRQKLKNLILNEKNSSEKDIQTKIAISKDFYVSPNEAEFFSYIILFNFDKPLDMEKNLGILASTEFDDVRNSPEISFMLKAISSIRETNVVEYFRCMKKSNYLQACSIFYFINTIRKGCLDQLSRMMQAKNSNDISLSYLLDLLHFNDYKQLSEYLETYGLNISYLNVEDSYEDETSMQSTFVTDWKIYEDTRNIENLMKIWKKNKKIEEKKALKDYPSNVISKNQTNYFNNLDVSRKFIINGDWKENNPKNYESRLIIKLFECLLNKMPPKQNFQISEEEDDQLNSEPETPKMISLSNKNSAISSQKSFPEPLTLLQKLPSQSFLKTQKYTEIPQTYDQKLPKVNNQSKPTDFTPPLIGKKPTKADPVAGFIDSPLIKVQPTKSKKDILTQKLKLWHKNTLRLCLKAWSTYIDLKRKLRYKKESEKNEMGKLFSYDFSSEIRNVQINTSEYQKGSYHNFLSSLNSERSSDDFISEIAYSLFQYAKPNQNKIFFKTCIFQNTLTNLSQDISSICHEAFCTNEKKMMRRRFNFKSDQNHEKEILYCSRMIQPLNEIFIDKDIEKKMKTLKNNIKGSDLIIFIISEDFNEDAVYYKIFRKYISKSDLENSKLLFLKASSATDQKIKTNKLEKNELKQKFGLKEIENNAKKIKILICDSEPKEKSFLKQISYYLKNLFQNKIRDKKFLLLDFVEIFSNIYHILKTDHDQHHINASLKADDFSSYFYNKNLMNLCLGKFFNSFNEILKEFSGTPPSELITIAEKKKINSIKKNQDILAYLMENCFLDVMDKKYRKLIKSNIHKFFDYKILEEMLISYFEGFALFDVEEIYASVNKYFSPLYGTFNYNQTYGIGGFWNEFFLSLLKCLYYLFKKHKLYIIVQKNFDFEINPTDFVDMTENEIENHIKWIKKMKITNKKSCFNQSIINEGLFYLGKRKSNIDELDYYKEFKIEKKACIENAYKNKEKDHIFIF